MRQGGVSQDLLVRFAPFAAIEVGAQAGRRTSMHNALSPSCPSVVGVCHGDRSWSLRSHCQTDGFCPTLLSIII